MRERQSKRERERERERARARAGERESALEPLAGGQYTRLVLRHGHAVRDVRAHGRAARPVLLLQQGRQGLQRGEACVVAREHRALPRPSPAKAARQPCAYLDSTVKNLPEQNIPVGFLN